MKKSVVLCQFKFSTQLYAYFTYLTDLKAGDPVLVDSSNGLGLAFVADLHPSQHKARQASAWILTKVDYAKLKHNLEGEHEVARLSI